MTDGGQGEAAGLALVKAAAAGHLSLVSALLADGAPVEGVDGGARTPLQAAVEEGHEKVVAALIEAGAHLEAASAHDGGKRALHLACRRGCGGVVKCLLRAGADIHARQDNGFTPLHDASYAGQVEVVKILIGSGANTEDSAGKADGWRPIHRAALWGQSEVIHVLLDAGADIEARGVGNENRPIHCAALRGHVNVLEALIERGCQLLARNERGQTALHSAARGGQLKTVQWLVVKGGIPHDVLTHENNTAEDLAHFHGYHNVAWWLHKLSMNTKPSKHKYVARALEEYEEIGLITLRWAQNGKHIAVGGQLPFRPWRIHYQDSQGWTPLHHAAFNNKKATVEELINLGALPLSYSHEQETPADLARSRGHTDLERLLTVTPPHLTLRQRLTLYEHLLRVISLAENQTENNISDQEEKNLRLSSVQMVSELVMKGAPLEPIGGHNIYPLHLAISSNRNDLLPLLLCAGAPLTSTADGLSILQQVWLSQDVTTNVGVIITRAMVHTLKYERAQILFVKAEDRVYQRLLDGISHLIWSMEGNHPWQASWSGFSKQYPGGAAQSRLKNPVAGTIQSSIHPKKKDDLGKSENDDAEKTCKICVDSDSNEKGICKDMISDYDDRNDLTGLLFQACELGATLTASFLKRSGACVTSWCGASGRTALHAALDAKHWDTAVALVRDMGANIFLQDYQGRFPLTLCPPDLRTQLMENALSHGYCSLDQLLSKAHDSSEKESTIHVMLLLATLYTNSAEGCTTVTANNGTGGHQGTRPTASQPTTDNLETSDNSWKTLFVYLVSILRKKRESDFTSSAWAENLMTCLFDTRCEDEKQGAVRGKRGGETDRGNKDGTGVTIGGRGGDDKIGDTEDEYWGYRETARNEDTTSREEYVFFHLLEKLSQMKLQERISSALNVELQQLIKITLMKALLISCKNGLTMLLHLLLTVGKVGTDVVVDEVSGSTALHVAAAQGRLGLCDFLLGRQASTTTLDRAGRTPAHLAYMFGHYTTGDRLVARAEHVTDKANNSPRKLFQGFLKYAATYKLDKTCIVKSHEQNDETSLVQAHLSYFKRKWRGSIEKAVRELHVDFTKGEAREVKEVLTRELTRILEKLEKVNPLFASSLQVLGSSADDLRLYAPDEFDCNVVLKNISGFHDGGLSVSLEQLSHKEASEKCYNFSLRVTATKDELKALVSGSNFVNMFFESLSCCLTSFEPSDSRLGYVLPGVRKTRVGANVSFAWEGSEFPLLLIDVDLVPVVEVPWPQQLDTPPLTPPMINSIHISSTGDDNWRCSFAAVENQIFRELPDERRLVLLACKLLVVTLKVESWAPKDIKEQYTYWIGHKFKIPAPAGFILKSSFLREMEEVKDDSLWKAPHLMVRIKSVFQRMCKTEDSSSNSDNNQRYYLSQVKAYFGGECEKPTVGYSAPEILRFLESW